MYPSHPQTNLTIQWKARSTKSQLLAPLGILCVAKGQQADSLSQCLCKDEEWLLEAEVCSPQCCHHHHLYPPPLLLPPLPLLLLPLTTAMAITTSASNIISTITMTDTTFSSSPITTTTTIIIITLHQSRPRLLEKEWLKVNLLSMMT